MPTQDVKLRDIQRRLERDVAAKIDEFGVPMDTDAVYDITVELHPIVVKYRQEAYRAYVEQMGLDMAQLGLEVAPARIQGYGPHATYDALARAAGFGEKPSNIVLELVDDETKELIKKSVPAFAFPNHRQVIEQMSARLTRTLMRHTLNAGRKAVEDTARLGRVRNATTKRPIGRRVGYARVLTGRESCAFCAMLASRGPVYSEDTATRRADGRRYHDGCDCRAVLVIEGQPWEGEQEFHRLQAAWREATWGDGAPAQDQWKRWQSHVSENGGGSYIKNLLTVDAERGAAPPKLPGVSRKGSKRTAKTALTGANPTGDADNCIRSVNAWLMRRQGYDISAIPGQPSVDAEASSKTWRDDRGKPPQWTGSDHETGGLAWEKVRNELEKMPEGSFGLIRYRRRMTAHVTGWEKTGNGLIIVDAQQAIEGFEYDIEKGAAGSFRWVNMQGFRPTPDTVKIVREE